MNDSAASPVAEWRVEDGRPVLVIRGDWHRDGIAPVVSGAPDRGRLPGRFDCSALGSFDSTLPAFLLEMMRSVGDGRESLANAALDGMPADLRGLMELALGVPEQSEAKARPGGGGSLMSWLAGMNKRVGESMLNAPARTPSDP